MRNLIKFIILLGIIVIGTGCQANPINIQSPQNSMDIPTALPPSTPIPEATTQVAATPDRSEATHLPERVSPTDTVSPVTGEVPVTILDAIFADAMERTGAAAEKIIITQAQAITWNDGSLGCPQPGMLYTQALVEGYWVVLEVDQQKYDYHAAENGRFLMCESGSNPMDKPSGTPDS
jgi:hypothetical protein